MTSTFNTKPSLNIWNKVKNWSKIRHDGKTLISAFAYFFIVISKVLFVEVWLGTRLFMIRIAVKNVFYITGTTHVVLS